MRPLLSTCRNTADALTHVIHRLDLEHINRRNGKLLPTDVSSVEIISGAVPQASTEVLSLKGGRELTDASFPLPPLHPSTTFAPAYAEVIRWHRENPRSAFKFAEPPSQSPSTVPKKQQQSQAQPHARAQPPQQPTAGPSTVWDRTPGLCMSYTILTSRERITPLSSLINTNENLTFSLLNYRHMQSEGNLRLRGTRR